MSMVFKPVGGASLGVSIPLFVEYGAKGARAGGVVKWSGVTGLVEAGIGIGGAVYADRKGAPDEDVALLAAMGGAGLATGVGIIILDELRKRALYAFKQRRGMPPKRIPLVEEGYPQLEERYPTAELVEEI